MLKQNKIQCLQCGDVIESFHRHDFKYCKCGAIFIDGGLEYQRYGGKSLKDVYIIDDEHPPLVWVPGKRIINE